MLKCHTNIPESKNAKCAGFVLMDMRNDSLSVHSQLHNLFRLGRHLLRATNYRALRARAFGTWDAVTCA